MRRKLFLLLLLTGCPWLNACSGLSDGGKEMHVFNPYVTKDGKQSFRFVASKTLPSYYGQADIQTTHEAWIGNELGRRQYCLNGYAINSSTVREDTVIYEGQCKQ